MELLILTVFRIAVMGLLSAMAELLIPEGSLRNAVSVAAGLAFVSAAASEILRIF